MLQLQEGIVSDYPPMAEELNFSSYYVNLTPTGAYPIDLVLSAVARAGKAYHHTSDWLEPDAYPEAPFEGDTWRDRIDNAGKRAAELVIALQTENDRLKRELTDHDA